MTIGFPDIPRQRALNEPIGELRSKLTQASTELVTGRKSDLALSLGSRTGEYNLIAKALADINAGTERLNLTKSRLSATSTVLSQIRESLTQFSVQAQSFFVEGNDLQNVPLKEARNEVSKLLQTLNTSFGGRTLFSGDEVTAKPFISDEQFFAILDPIFGNVDDLATLDGRLTEFFAEGGQFDTEVYLGGNGNAAGVRLPNGGSIEFGFRGDDISVKKALEGLVRIVYAPEDSDASFINNSLKRLFRSEALLIDAEAELGRQQNIVESSIEVSLEQKILLQQSEDALAGVDPYEAATRVQTLETQLQTAYTVTARLSRLTLTNYI